MIDGEDDDQVEIELDDGDTEADKPAKAAGEDAAETAAAGENDDEDEMVVEIEGLEEPPVEETPVIRSLRQRERELARRVKELESREQANIAEEVGKEPDLWEDSDGDQAEHDRKRDAWKARKAAAEAREEQKTAALHNAEQRLQNSVASMRANAAKQGVPGYQEAEEAVGAALPSALGNAIPIYFGDRAPALVKALHAHPAILEKITTTAKTDLVQALFDLWDLSKGVKMVPKRKSNLQPEEIVRGSAPLSTVAADRKLAELEKAVDAGKPGSQEALMAHLRAKRQQARAA